MRHRFTVNLYDDSPHEADLLDYFAGIDRRKRQELHRLLLLAGFNALIRNRPPAEAALHALNPELLHALGAVARHLAPAPVAAAEPNAGVSQAPARGAWGQAEAGAEFATVRPSASPPVASAAARAPHHPGELEEEPQRRAMGAEAGPRPSDAGEESSGMQDPLSRLKGLRKG